MLLFITGTAAFVTISLMIINILMPAFYPFLLPDSPLIPGVNWFFPMAAGSFSMNRCLLIFCLLF